MLGKKKEKIYTCTHCGFVFSNLDVPRSCSNCFACTGCEIYICPSCRNEVVIKPMKNLMSGNPGEQSSEGKEN